MATRGIQTKLSNGSVTEIKIGGTAANQSVAILEDLEMKRDLTNTVFGTDPANSTEVELDTGHMKFNGTATVFEDENLDPTMMGGKGSLPTAIDFKNSNVQIASFVNGQVDAVSGCREIPHKAKLNLPDSTAVSLSFHVHGYPVDAVSGNVRLALEYTISLEGVVAPDPTTIYVTAAVGPTPWVKTSITFPDIPVPESLGGQVHFSFSRLGNDALDTYNGDLAIATIGFHYEIDSGGSREIVTK